MKKRINIFVVLFAIAINSLAQFSGDFKIINLNSGKAVSVTNGSNSSLSILIQWNFGNSNDQIWNFQSTGDGYYYIAGKYSGKVIEVKGASTLKGAFIQINDKNGNNNQLWQINLLGNNQYAIINKGSGMALSVASASKLNGAKLVQWTSIRTASEQKWVIEPVFSGDYKIENLYSNKAISVGNDSYSSESILLQWTFLNGSSQIWNFQSAGNGYYYIVGKYSEKIIEVQDGSIAEDALIQLNDKNGNNNQLWQINSLGNNQFAIINKGSGKALTMQNGSSSDGANLNQWTYYSTSSAQKWTITALGNVPNPVYNTYSIIPGSALSPNFTVTVDTTRVLKVGQGISPLKADGYPLNLSYARYVLAKPGTAVKIEVGSSTLSSCEFFPKNLGITPTINYTNKKISLILPANLTTIPRKLLFKVDGQKWLAIFIDLPEENTPKLSDANVKNIMDFNVDNSGFTVQTSVIQNAIDWMATNNQGKTILYFPTGTYSTNQLTVLSNLQIYLQDGAMIKATSHPVSDNPLINVKGDGSTTFKLFGRGVIDGNSLAIFANNTNNNTKKLVVIENCASVTVLDVILRDQCNWALSTFYSKNVFIDNVKVIGSEYLWTDAFDILSCTNYTNNNSFAWSTDDNVAIMSGNTPTEKVVFNNLVGVSICSGVRFGWNSMANIESSEFNDCEWIFCNMNMMAFHQLRNGFYGRVVFNRCNIDAGATIKRFTRLYTTDPENWGEGGSISMNSLEFRNCKIENHSNTLYDGDPSYKIKKVLYDNTYIGSTLLSTVDQIQLLSYSNVGSFVFNTINNSSVDPYTTVRAESFNEQSGTVDVACSEGGNNVAFIKNEDYLYFSNLDFGTGAKSFKARVATANTGGNIELRVDRINSSPIAVCNITNTGGWQIWSDFLINTPTITGIRNVYLVFTGGTDYLFDIQSFQFDKAWTQKIEAESYSSMSGIQTGACNDAGGTLCVGWIDTWDWLVYSDVTFPASGIYTIEFRVASPNGGKLGADFNNGAIQLGTINVPATGDWNNWTTVKMTINIANAGTYNLGIYAPVGDWNINWLQITQGGLKSVAVNNFSDNIQITPNPVSDGKFTIYLDEVTESNTTIEIVDLKGVVKYSKRIENNIQLIHIQTDEIFPEGLYLVKVTNGDSQKISKILFTK
jgi:hypothetical protein